MRPLRFARLIAAPGRGVRPRPRPARSAVATALAAALGALMLASCAGAPPGPASGSAAAPVSSVPGAGTPGPLEAPALGGVPAAPLAPPTVAESKALAAAMASVRWRYGIPGLSVAIAYADGSIWTGHAGVTDVKAKIGVRTETAFAFGSVTKTFTAALILKLVEDGAIGLDDPVIRWLPEYAGRTFLGTTPARRQLVTVRMLLAQTSGIYDYFNSLPLDARLRASKKRAWSPDDVLAYVKKPLFIAGDGWSYSNTNYLLLGLIAEKAGGAPLATLMRTRLLEPLGLTSLYTQVAETSRAPVAKG